jgi:hypothetical protein
VRTDKTGSLTSVTFRLPCSAQDWLCAVVDVEVVPGPGSAFHDAYQSDATSGTLTGEFTVLNRQPTMEGNVFEIRPEGP